MRTFFFKLAIRIALRRRAPDSIPLSGMERLKKRNYYTLMLNWGEDTSFLADSIEGNTVVGRWVSPHTDPLPGEIDVKDCEGKGLYISYYLREYQFDFYSFYKFLCFKALFLCQILLAYNYIVNFFYSRKSIYAKDRIDILKNILDKTCDSDSARSLNDLMTEKYGRRWTIHPKGFAVYRKNRLLLDSLVASGDLNVSSGSYTAEPRAASTIAEFELLERRHQDQVAVQRSIVRITWVLAIIGIAQTLVAWLPKK